MTTAPKPQGDRLNFGSVKVIESLKPHEQRTGWNLFNELQPIGLMSKPQVTCEYTPVQTAAELQARLAEIRDEVRATGRTPILQLETHGSPDGIALGGGDFVPWPVLRPWLTEINAATRLNLFVLLSACHGRNLVQVVQPSERAAVLALIGPKRIMYPDELERAAVVFYRTLFEKMDAPTAWRAMNATIDPDPSKTTFAVFTAKFNFRYIMHDFLKVRETEAELAAAEARIEAMAAAQGVPASLIEQRRPALRDHLRNFEANYESTKSNYFFIDLYPENATRFPVTLHDCRLGPLAE
jgi:hypothetical protein